jgi:ferredoxin
MLWAVLILIGILLLIIVIIWLIGEKGIWLHPSTKVFIEEGGWERLFKLKTFHGYVYMRWQKSYLSFFINQVQHRSSQAMRKWWSGLYHAKVLTKEQAKKIITINEAIPYQKIEKVIPYPVAHDFILDASPKITAFECGCRHARKVHCEPTQVCLWVGQPFADFMDEHHPLESRVISKDEALSILKAEHERGHVHTAWFKDAMLDRFYVICNCCPNCCGGIEVMTKYGIPMLDSSGFVAEVDQDLCNACGTCEEICPFNALHVEEVATLDWDECMGCGVCVGQCPNNAITIIKDERKGIPLDIYFLVKKDSMENV